MCHHDINSYLCRFIVHKIWIFQVTQSTKARDLLFKIEALASETGFDQKMNDLPNVPELPIFDRPLNRSPSTTATTTTTTITEKIEPEFEEASRIVSWEWDA